MNPLVEELVELKNKLKKYEQLEDKEMIQYLKRLKNIEISKELIKQSQINEILKVLSKNKKNLLSTVVVNSAIQLREFWKEKLIRKKKGEEIQKKEIISKNLNDLQQKQESN